MTHAMVSSSTNEPRALTEAERKLHATVRRKYIDVRDADVFMAFCIGICLGTEIHVLGVRNWATYDFAVVHHNEEQPDGRVGKYSDEGYSISTCALRDAIITAWGSPAPDLNLQVKEAPRP